MKPGTRRIKWIKRSSNESRNRDATFRITILLSVDAAPRTGNSADRHVWKCPKAQPVADFLDHLGIYYDPSCPFGKSSATGGDVLILYKKYYPPPNNSDNSKRTFRSSITPVIFY
jgi:hypothetical protein